MSSIKYYLPFQQKDFILPCKGRYNNETRTQIMGKIQTTGATWL